ncbi:GGDEF domain-containing protein [Kineococcus terrestris]|uniref:GGDEF domain-containing protein n=1 Tax=Kineococcus terrestris TaxID=2044856 RepID=UPI0034DB1D05
MKGPGLPLVRALLVVGGALAVLVVALPEGPVRAVLYCAVAAACAATVFAGARRYRPVRPAGWLLVGAGVGAWAVGDVVYIVLEDVLGAEPFPSVADVAYLAAYPLLAAGFWRFVRARQGGRGRDGFVDSAILVVGFSLLVWVTLVKPSLLDASVSATARAVGAAYPIGDVLLLAVLVQLLTSSGARTAAFRLLVTGASLMLLADAAYQLVSLRGNVLGLDEGLVDALFLASYLCTAGAALHPSMRRLTDSPPREGAELTRARLLALTAASLLSPGTLAVQAFLGRDLEVWAVVLTSVVLFLLVVLRMSGLLHQVQDQARQLAALARTDALTGLPNRRSGQAELARQLERARREGLPLCVALLDLDRFKTYNDTFGHPAGDRLLVGSAAGWRARLQGRGVLARWGGEEFLLLLPGLPAVAAVEVVDELRAATADGQTFSGGVAQWDGAESDESLVARADEALYAAKAAGRDRVLPAPAPDALSARGH